MVSGPRRQLSMEEGVPSSLYREVETSLMQSSQLSGTAKVVSKGGIMAGGSRQVYAVY